MQQYAQRVRTCLTRHYLTPLPVIAQVRARHERDIVLSIRRKLKKAQLVLRESDKGGNLYVGRTSYFAQKAAEYRAKTGAYEELASNPIEEMLVRVTRLLNDLHMKTKEISVKQYKEMMPSRSKVELAYMYFNPKTHKEPMSLRPIMNTIHASTTGISKLLDRLIRPLFDRMLVRDRWSTVAICSVNWNSTPTRVISSPVHCSARSTLPICTRCYRRMSH